MQCMIPKQAGYLVCNLVISSTKVLQGSHKIVNVKVEGLSRL